MTDTGDKSSRDLAVQFLRWKGVESLTQTPGQYDHVDIVVHGPRGDVGVEVKNRYCTSDKYPDCRCDYDKVKEVESVYEGRGYLLSIYTDGIIKLGHFKYAQIEEMGNQPRNTYFGGQQDRVTKKVVVIPDIYCHKYRYRTINGQTYFQTIVKR